MEINPVTPITDKLIAEGHGWWIDTCYIESYDSTEIDLTFNPSSIEPDKSAIMTLWVIANPPYKYNEELGNFLERNISLEPNVGTISRIGNGVYKYIAPNSIPGDSDLVVKVNYEQFTWHCAGLETEVTEKVLVDNISDEFQCGCPIWLLTQVWRNYGTDSIMIAWDSLDVKVEPDTIYPGDTALVVIKKRLADGTLVDFDSTQTYEAGMLEGCILGKLIAGTQEGSYVYNVTQPIYFVADTSADSTGSVFLRVGIINPIDKLQNKNGLQKDIVESECFIGWQTSSYDEVTVVKENPLEIIYPSNHSPDEWINSIPEMPEISYAIQLHSHFGQPIKLICEYEISYVYKRRWSSSSPICDRKSKVIYHDTLEAYGGVIYTNQVVFTKDKATFEFTARGYRGSGCNEIITSWDEGNDVFTGGNVVIRVTAADLNWNAFATKEQVANRILGSNPDSVAIAQYATNEIRAILYVESKTNQFTGEGIDPSMWWPYNEAGFPLYGPPNGYGLMQIDNSPVATEKQLWNWKANIDAGTSKYYNLKNIALNRIKRYPYTEEVLLKCAFQLYHSNEMYYKWNKFKGWKKNEGVKHNYGFQAYKKYQELQNY